MHVCLCTLHSSITQTQTFPKMFNIIHIPLVYAQELHFTLRYANHTPPLTP